MKFEFGIISIVGFLVFVILGFVIESPNEIPSITQLEEINHQSLVAQETKNQNLVDQNRVIMQEKLQKMATHQLGIHISNVELEPFFPFKDASDIEQFDESFTGEICNIIPNIPTHLKIIKNSEMFSLFSKKYGNYPMELFLQDERRTESIVHYSFVVKSNNENKTASMWVHLNSCTNEHSVPYNLTCRDLTSNELTHTRALNEITDSLSNNEFCTIDFPQWKQELLDYGKSISDKIQIHHEQLSAIKDKPTFEEVMAFQNELERLVLLGHISGKAAMNGLDDIEVYNLKEEYISKFGKITEDLLVLIEK